MARRRRQDAGRTAAGWLVAPLALLGLGVATAPSAAVRIHVVVDGRPVAVGQPATVERALELAGIAPRDGRLHAAVSHRVIGRHADAAVITRNGEVVARHDRVHEGDVVRTEDGTDWVEATLGHTEAIPAAGLPEVETHAWRPGTAGVRRVVVGARSDEPVSTTVVTPAVQAHQVPGRVVTLSFDDGPHAEWTPLVLDILKRRHVRAVFCVVGEMVDVHPDLVARIAAEGHRLCDHSVDHADLTGASADVLATEIGPTADRVAAITGERPAFFRAPYGVFSDAVVARAREARLRPLGWAVDTEDFAQPTPTTLVPQIIDAVVPGAVILFHDGGGDRRRTVDALPYVITALRRQGYRFVLPGIEHPPSAERAAAPA